MLSSRVIALIWSASACLPFRFKRPCNSTTAEQKRSYQYGPYLSGCTSTVTIPYISLARGCLKKRQLFVFGCSSPLAPLKAHISPSRCSLQIPGSHEGDIGGGRIHVSRVVGRKRILRGGWSVYNAPLTLPTAVMTCSWRRRRYFGLFMGPRTSSHLVLFHLVL